MTASDAPANLASLPRRRIFVAAALALFTAGLSFALRAAVITSIEASLLRALDPLHSGERAGALLGAASLGFAAALALATVFLERIGMGRALALSAAGFILGTGIAVGAPVVPEAALGLLRGGFLLCGIGWGFMEAAINPLIAALYPDDKTARLNALHAWWPAGVIVGGFVAIAGSHWDLSWQTQLGISALPAFAVRQLCRGVSFPRTARAAAGVAWARCSASCCAARCISSGSRACSSPPPASSRPANGST